jgi:hypothetical protein
MNRRSKLSRTHAVGLPTFLLLDQLRHQVSLTDTCGLERNGFSLELLDFPPVPEDLQEGPFYPTSTPIQIWQITRPQGSNGLFSF